MAAGTYDSHRPFASPYGWKVPSGPAGAGRGDEPGTFLPGTPFTLCRRVREGERRERDRVAVHVERVIVVVRERVARLVVAGVELRARGAAPDRLLLRRLDLLRAREEAAGGDAVLDERLVVAAPVERRVVVRLADEGVVRLEDVLDRGRAGRDRHRSLERRLVGVVDHLDVVRRADHVEVQVEGDLVLLGLAQAVHVGRRADQAFFLSAPPREAQRVLRLQLRELLGELQQRGGTAAVVVDPGACLDGVEMGSGHDDVVVVAAVELGDHVGLRIVHHRDGRGRARPGERLAGGEARADHRDGDRREGRACRRLRRDVATG